MGRFSSSYNSTATGDKTGQSAYLAMIADLEAYQSNGIQAWQRVYDYGATPPNYNYLYLSKGNRALGGGAGDARIWVRLEHNNGTLYYSAFRDATTTNGTGTDQTTQAAHGIIGGAPDNTVVHSVVSEYEATFAFVNAVNSPYAYNTVVNFGVPVRHHLLGGTDGVAFLSSGATASGSPVVLSVDRDLTGIVQPGKQKVWIYDCTPEGNALITPNVVEAQDVTAVTDTTITVAALGNNRSTGAIVGLDPSSTIVGYGHNSSSAEYGIIGVGTAYAFSANQLMQGYSALHYPVYALQNDPNTFGERLAFFAEVCQHSAAPLRLRRGFNQHIRIAPEAPFSAIGTDTLSVVEGGVTNKYMPIFNVINSAYDGGGSYAVCLGPVP